MYIGAVVQKQDLDLNKNHALKDNDGAYFMHLYDGGLFGSGKRHSDREGLGTVKVGDRVGVLAKVGEQGFVRYFHNSKELGPGFRPGEDIKDWQGNPTGEILGPIKSPLVIAAQTCYPGHSFELIQDAQTPE